MMIIGQIMNNIRKSIIIVIFSFFCLLFANSVGAAEYTITQLTDNDSYENSPQIHNGQIVWSMFDGNDFEIFFYDGTQVVQITDNNYPDGAPQIHNGQIVWRGYDGNDDEVFLFNGTQTIQLTVNQYNVRHIKIHR